MDVVGTLNRLGGGRLLEELAEAVQQTADEVRRTGQPGAVTLKLTVRRLKAEEMVEISETLTRTVPKKPARGAVYYVINGELHARDVRQPELPIRAVKTDSVDEREISTERAVREI